MRIILHMRRSIVSSLFKVIRAQFGCIVLRELLLGACVLLMTAFTSVAYASHYVVTYKGGISYFTPDAPYAPYQLHYSLNKFGQWAGGGLLVGSLNPLAPPTEGTVYCSGQIQSTLTWTLDPGEKTLAPTPSVIIVKQNVSVSFNADTGQWDDGIGQSSTDSNRSGISASDYVVISSPGNKVNMKVVDPTVDAVGNLHPPSASVAFSDSVIVPHIVLSGTTAFPHSHPNPCPHILVGQQLSARVNLGIPTDPNMHPNYIWSTSGGHPFAAYTAGSVGKVVPWRPLNSAQTNFFFAGETIGPSSVETIQCTATVKAGGQRLCVPLTAMVNLDEPDFSFSSATGIAQLIPLGAPNKLALCSRGYDHPSEIAFTGSVTTPSQYGGGGVFFFAQLIDPNRVETFQDGSQYLPPGSNSYGLDKGYPYPFDSPGTFPANGQKIVAHYESWISLARKNNGYPETGAAVNVCASMYLMYRPPGANICDVPLACISWCWGGVATYKNRKWVLSSSSVQSDPPFKTPYHPTWNLVNSNTGS